MSLRPQLIFEQSSKSTFVCLSQQAHTLTLALTKLRELKPLFIRLSDDLNGGITDLAITQELRQSII